MVAIDTFPDHAISWVDLAARDLDAAIDFYTGLFGWTTFNDGETPYHIFMVDERPVGGVMAMPPEMGEMPPVWSVYVAVADADATCVAAVEAGGAVMQEPFEIPGGGRIAVLADPAGAAFCIMEGNDEGLKVMDEPGAPCWFDCMSRDVAAGTAFYESVFGWAPNAMEMDGMQYTMLELDGEPICGTMALPPGMPDEVPSHWVVNIDVADCDAAAAYVNEHGGTIVAPIMDTPFGRACSFIDPWGAMLNVIDRSKADPENRPEEI